MEDKFQRVLGTIKLFFTTGDNIRKSKDNAFLHIYICIYTYEEWDTTKHCVLLNKLLSV